MLFGFKIKFTSKILFYYSESVYIFYYRYLAYIVNILKQNFLNPAIIDYVTIYPTSVSNIIIFSIDTVFAGVINITEQLI